MMWTHRVQSFATAQLILYMANWFVGCLIYPIFRVHVRAYQFDSEIPLATGFFEVKEHWLGIGLAVVVAHFVMSRVIDHKRINGRGKLFHGLALLIAFIVGCSTLIGLYLVAINAIRG